MLDNKGKLVNPECRIENCSKCNALCICCPREKMTRPKVIMEFELFESLVNQAKDLGTTTISVFGFGEPFIDLRLTEKIEICEDLGLETFITTNGSLCTWERMHDLFTVGLKHIRFSIHGLYDNYEKIHKGLSFDNVMTNLFSTILLRDKIAPDCKISVTAIPMNDDEDEHLKMWDFVGIDWIEVWKAHNFTNGRDYRKLNKKKKSCNRLFRGPIQINADGKMIVCCFDFDAKLTIGDTKKDSIRDILKGEIFTEIQRKHKSGDLEGLICDLCDQLNEEKESPLLYSNRDPEKNLDTTSSIKFKL